LIRHPFFIFFIVLLAVGLEFPLSRSLFSAEAQSLLTIQGTVTNENGQPVSEAKVTCTGQGGALVSVLSQGDGKFTITVTKPGTYTLTASANGFRAQSQKISFSKPEEIPSGVNLQLTPTSLHVVLRDERANEPLGGGVVSARLRDSGPRDGVALRALENRRGEYFFGKMAAGVYEVTAVVPGYEAKVMGSVLINDRATAELPLLLSRISAIPLGIKVIDRSFVPPKLPSGLVHSIFSDSNGAVWFATDKGASRYNGRDFESSETSESPLGPLQGKSVNAIARATDGTLWFGTDRGIFIQSEPVGLVEPLKIKPTNLGNGGLDGKPIRVFEVGRGNEMWIGTSSGLYRWSPETVLGWKAEQGFTDAPVNAIRVAADGRVFVATDDGLFRFEAGVWKKLAFPVPAGTTVGPTRALCEDRNGTLWVTTQRGLFSIIAEFITPVSHPLLDRPLGSACLDSVGNFWFCLPGRSGVVVFDPRRPEAAELLSESVVRTVATDADNNLWFGTEKGAIRHDAYSFVTFDTSRGLPESDVRSLAAGNGESASLWVGTARGVFEFNGATFLPLVKLPKNVSVRSLATDGGELWVGADDGVWRWNGSEAKKVEGTGLTNIRGVLRDRRRPVVWVATASELFSVNPLTLKIEGEPVPIDGEVKNVMQATNGALWIATDRGAYRYEPNSAELVVIGTPQGLESLDVRCIIEQPTPGKFWLATGRGIETFDGNAFVPNLLRSASSGSDVRTLFLDHTPNESFLWVGTGDGGLRKFLLSQEGIAQTYRRDRYDFAGAQPRMILKTPDGARWIATESGLTRHLSNRRAPSVEIRLEVDGAEIQNPNSTSLKAGQHRVKFKFTGVSQTGDVTYLYRIDSQGWRILSAERAGNDRTEFSVSNFGSGEHVFEVQALNRDLYGIKSTPRKYIVWIDRPFYLRAWFWIVCFAVVFSGSGGVWAYQKQRSREYVLPPHLKQFKAIERNPYVVGNPIRNSAMFFGREDDFQYVARKFEGAQQGLVIVFCGERRTGKSSILYQIMNGRIGDKFVPVFVDMQEMIIRDDAEFFQRTAKLIADGVDKLGGEPIVQPAFGANGNNAYSQFREFIDEVLKKIGERQLVILVDEYELLEVKVDDGKLSKDIFSFLAGLIDRHDRLSMVFTGSRKLEDRDRRYWREMLRRSLFRKISYLTPNDTRRLITEPVKDTVVYGKGVVDAVVRLTAGQPFYTQVICQNVVDCLNEQKRHYILRSDLKEIVDEVVNNPLPQMIYFWEGLGDDEKIVLSLVAETLVDENDAVTAERITQKIADSKYPVTLTEATIRLTLEELFRNEILDKFGEGAFSYHVDLLRYWIKRSHSVWQVVREVKSL
jgi:ligand-binding sensor domain-containing protein/AAA+ ATPase superfamily predicted ATPase